MSATGRRIAATVTRGAVRCSAWLAVAVISENVWIMGLSLVTALLLVVLAWKWFRRQKEPTQVLQLFLAVGVLLTATATASLGLRLIAWMNESERRMQAMEKEMPNLIEWTHYWK